MATEPPPTEAEREQMVLRIQRLDGEQLVLDGYGLAHGFFLGDPSSVAPNSYDSLAGHGVRAQITTADITAINTTMRARSSHRHWEPIANRDLDWLAVIDPELDLIASNDEQWEGAHGANLSQSALRDAIGPGRGPSVATKVLHLKRPRLFPVLDDFVAVMLGMNMPSDAPPARRAELAWTLMAHLREQGRLNLDALVRIHSRLQDERIERPLVRILDAIVWFAHPASGVPGAARVIDVRVP
jgi:hypothetical protein